jgi:aryl-alcohol dehydrogenase-like predicted oxidoreductase
VHCESARFSGLAEVLRRAGKTACRHDGLRNGVGVIGIRAVQAGALTSAVDRSLAPDHPEMRDYARAAGFRRLAEELGTIPAALTHRYALSLDSDTLVPGVKNRRGLAECVTAAEAGPLPPELMDRVDAAAREQRRVANC